MIEEIAVNEPTIVEVEVAIQRMNSGKAPGINSITAELLKVCVGFSAHKVHELMVEIWKKEKIPENWKKGLIKLPKKENLKECKNFRGITLLSVVGKILGRIIIDRIGEGVDGKLKKERTNYRKGRGTTDQVFILQNIIEQVNEWQVTLYLNFVEFEKVFDSIHRESLWKIMKKYGVSDKTVKMIKLFYDNFQCAVEVNGEICAWFDIKTGVK